MKQGGPEDEWADVRGTRLSAHVAHLSSPCDASIKSPGLTVHL